MLGALAKYIFGGMLGDAPETTSPELQYQTREVNDWLLVDMPDQAIDDEDMDSESDDDDDEDEILTALPLLMAEETVQPLQSYEEMKGYSVCDNSYDKVQRHYVDKTHSVPSAVQHHSGDKTQGNFVDNIEAVSVEVEDNISGKIQDISVNIQECSDNVTQDESVAQVFDDSVDFQSNSDDEIRELFDEGNQSALPEVQHISDDKSNSAVAVDTISVTENSAERSSNYIFKKSTKFEIKPMPLEQILHMQLAKLNRQLGYPDNYKNTFMDKKSFKTNSSVDYSFQNDFKANEFSDKPYADGEHQEKSRVILKVHSTLEDYGLDKLFQPVNFHCAPRRLYSQVVQMGRQNQVSTDPMKDIFSDELGKNYDRCVRVFGDEIQESSDEEMNETSDDETNENSNDEMNENSDGEEDNSYNDGSNENQNTVAQMSSDEESDEYSEDESSDAFPNADFNKRFHFIPHDKRAELNLLYESREIIKEKLMKMVDKLLNHSTGCIPDTEYEHVVGFRNVPQSWYAYQTQEPYSHASLLVRDMYEPIARYPHLKAYICNNFTNKKLKRRPLRVEEKPAANNLSLITNSAEILQNIINQKSTNLPTKTAVELEHIKELKSVQQAIQFENRKYLTRSQLNRQNKNYMYQSSTKSNRRRNLQRNHSGANNNRKC